MKSRASVRTCFPVEPSNERACIHRQLDNRMHKFIAGKQCLGSRVRLESHLSLCFGCNFCYQCYYCDGYYPCIMHPFVFFGLSAWKYGHKLCDGPPNCARDRGRGPCHLIALASPSPRCLKPSSGPKYILYLILYVIYYIYMCVFVYICVYLYLYIHDVYACICIYFMRCPHVRVTARQHAARAEMRSGTAFSCCVLIPILVEVGAIANLTFKTVLFLVSLTHASPISEVKRETEKELWPLSNASWLAVLI